MFLLKLGLPEENFFSGRPFPIKPKERERRNAYAQTLEPLAGVSFRLADGKGNMLKFMRQVDGVYHPDESGVETLTTDAEGKLRIRYIPAD